MASIDRKNVTFEMVYQWCVTVISQMLQSSPSTFLRDMKAAVNAARDRSDFRGMKTIARDLWEWSSGLSSEQRSAIDGALQQHLGCSLSDGPPGSVTVREILKRRTISSDDEYQLLMARADEISGNPRRRQELNVVNEVLSEYEVRRHRP